MSMRTGGVDFYGLGAEQPASSPTHTNVMSSSTLNRMDPPPKVKVWLTC